MQFFILYIGLKFAYFKYRAIFFVMQTICQTCSDIKARAYMSYWHIIR